MGEASESWRVGRKIGAPTSTCALVLSLSRKKHLNQNLQLGSDISHSLYDND